MGTLLQRYTQGRPGPVLVVDADRERGSTLVDALHRARADALHLHPGDFLRHPEHPRAAEMVIVGCHQPAGDLATLLAGLRERFVGSGLYLLHDEEAPAPELHGTAAGLIDGRLPYPCDPGRLASLLQAAPSARGAAAAPRAAASQATLFRGLIGMTPSMQRIRRQIGQVARTDATVMVLGETGTGKEVVARNLHNLSQRSKRPFVAVNCGAIPRELLESELFGHEKGAFTGALTARRGRFELAEGGTLFLDEIGDMPLSMQVKLLRVLQEGQIDRVGSTRSTPVDVRIIAATHRDLEARIAAGEFREDLYYRLHVFPIEMPPLRERVADLPFIVDEMVSRVAAQRGARVSFDRGALDCLGRYPWPGNIRELGNLVERLAITHPHEEIGAAELPPRYRAGHAGDDVAVFTASRDADCPGCANGNATLAVLPPEGLVLKDYIADIEQALISQALAVSNGVVAHTAKLLGMRRTTLVEKLRKYGLNREAT